MQEKSLNNVDSMISDLSNDEVKFDRNFIKDELCPKLWNQTGKLKPKVREKLLEFANRFYIFLGVEAPVIDILFTGSLAGYDYHEGSDIDIHVVVDFKLIGSEDFVRSMMNTKKHHYNSMRKGVRIKGYELECYCQDKEEYHKPSGLYSLLNDRWIIQPQRPEPKVDVELVEKIISVIHKATLDLDRIEDNQERLNKAIELKNSVIKMRRIAVRRRNEFSEPNLAFKTLRRAGVIDLLFNIIRTALDKKLSLENLAKQSDNLILEGDELSEKKIRDIIRKELKDLSTKDEVRELIRQSLHKYHKWMWEKKGIWMKAI